jgi:hypothetical protein
MVTMPTINPNGTLPGELLEQHELAFETRVLSVDPRLEDGRS